MQEAIQATLAAIERRARLYRRTVMAVVAIALASPAAALILRSWHPLAGWILLVPVVGGFFLLDGRILRRWRRVVQHRLTEGRLDLSLFSATISRHPLIPRSTLAGMLDLLEPGRALTDRGARRLELRILFASGSLTLALSAVFLLFWYPSTALAVAAAAAVLLWIVSLRV